MSKCILVHKKLKQQLKEHNHCGLGDNDGPYYCDCACRNTESENKCAEAGCGFCKASVMEKVK